MLLELVFKVHWCIPLISCNRFASVKKRFTVELKEFRGRETQSLVAQNIISLLMGMKFFRVKVVSIFACSFIISVVSVYNINVNTIRGGNVNISVVIVKKCGCCHLYQNVHFTSYI